jgi:hypothetical protein
VLNLSRIVDTAFRIGRQQGVAGIATIVRPAGTVVNPTTNVASGTMLTQNVRCVVLQETKWRTRGGAWSSATGAVLIPAADLAFLPDIGDRITFAGVTSAIMERSDITPDGVTTLAWEFAFGGIG